MVMSIRDAFVWRFSCRYIHKALKQLATITEHLGEHCVTFARMLSCGYCIVGFCREDFNLVIGSIRDIKIRDHFIRDFL